MIVFVCSQGKLRSRTAELLCLFGGMEARSCGTDTDAQAPLSNSLLRQADLVICMEKEHKEALKSFQHYGQCDAVTLGIRDVYNRLDPLLIRTLIYQVSFHSTDVAAAMQRGADMLESLPHYQAALGTFSPEISDNPAFAAFP